MKSNNVKSDSAMKAFLEKARSLYPVAHGTLSFVKKRCNSKYCKACKSGEGHPAWIFTFRKDGKQRCMHVQNAHVEIIRQAIENGRKLEEAILEEGLSLLERLRSDG